MKLEEGKIYLCKLGNTESEIDEDTNEYYDAIEAKLKYVNKPHSKWEQPDGEKVDPIWEVEALEEVEEVIL